MAPVRPRPWLVAGAIGVIAMPVVAWTTQPTEDGLVPLDWPGLCCVAVVIAVAVPLVIRTVRAQRRLPAPVWTAARHD